MERGRGNKLKIKELGFITITAAVATGVLAHKARKEAEKHSYTAELMEPIKQREQGFYEKYVKRVVDVACSAGAIAVFSPLYLGTAALVKVKLGSPVLFTQERPGMIGADGKETIFKMYKFRTMTDKRDEKGELLPDEDRLTKIGAWLRSTSLDELPEAFNIFNGTMSVIGPRPQLVRDMVFMSKEQRQRHTAKPGLSGLAQVNGRNAIDWEKKLRLDLEYLECISLSNDMNIVLLTIKKVFLKSNNKEYRKEVDILSDQGDSLLQEKRITKNEYDSRSEEAHV